jgi:hypothetical protein
MFSRFDTNKDGKLSKEEVPAEVWEKLSKADGDADGLVSKDELEKVHRARGDAAPRPDQKAKGDKPKEKGEQAKPKPEGDRPKPKENGDKPKPEGGPAA